MEMFNLDKLAEYAKVVLCKEEECLWFKPLDTPRFVEYVKGYVPLGEQDAYTGVCDRPGVIGVGPKTIESPTSKQKLATCQCRSERHNKGHVDFSRFLQSDGTPKGGMIRDNLKEV